MTHPRQRRHPNKKASQVIRIIIAGGKKSGKTSFISTISQYTEHDTRHGWFFGRIRVDNNLILHLMEPPIGNEYDFMWLRDVIGRVRASGFIVMADSARPQGFAEFVSILYTIRGFHDNIPMLVAANRQDHIRAWSVEDIQIGLGLSDIDVYPCVASDYGSVRDILVTLLNRLPFS